MANIGRVYTDSYYSKALAKDVTTITMDIRTLTQRKKFTISVNKLKYKDGKLKTENIIQGMEEHPDYHIWANFSNRGESLPSVIVGSIKNAISTGGTLYKKAVLFDPFVSRYSIYFSLFEASEEEKQKNSELLYNVVASPYRPNNQNSDYNAPQAQPEYSQEPQTYQTPSGNEIPVTQENISGSPEEDEIPF